MGSHESLDNPDFILTLRDIEPVMVDRLMSLDDGVERRPIMDDQAHKLIGVEYHSQFAVPFTTPRSGYTIPSWRTASIKDIEGQPMEFKIEVGDGFTSAGQVSWTADNRQPEITNRYRGEEINAETVRLALEAIQTSPTPKEGYYLTMEPGPDGHDTWVEHPNPTVKTIGTLLGRLGIKRH